MTSDILFLVLHFFKKTYSTFQLSAAKSNELIWWQIFGSIYNDFIVAANYILNKPHSRLIDEVIHTRLERVRRLPPESEERASQNRETANYYHRTHKKELSVDTPKNRFFKYAVGQIAGIYREVKVFVLGFAVSDEFKEELDRVESELTKLSNHPLLKRSPRTRAFGRSL